MSSYKSTGIDNNISIIDEPTKQIDFSICPFSINPQRVTNKIIFIKNRKAAKSRIYKQFALR